MDALSNLLDNVVTTVSSFLTNNPMILLAVLIVGVMWLFLSDDDDYRYRRGRRDYRDDRYRDDRYYDDRDYR